MSQIYQQSPVRPKDEAALSLLSLSLAAAQAKPLQFAPSTDTSAVLSATLLSGPAVASTPASIGNSAKHHRRLSSTGKARRRLSDARDAAVRPSPAALQTSAPSLSLASLSLSSSPPRPGFANSQQLSASFSYPSKFTSPIPIRRNTFDDSRQSIQIEDEDEMMSLSGSLPDDGGIGVSASGGNPSSKGGKKRGTDHKCETCSKIYRHPSCLIKHRWEHTPHWREASKFVLSKHQQVQLLEAAAILSHLSPSSSTGTSLPEDRSLWPSFLSGGTLTLPATSPPVLTVPSLPPAPKIPISSSVPATLSSPGPRLHDYTLSSSTARTRTGIISGPGMTQVRPGLIGVPTTSPGISPASASIPVPVPIRSEGLTGPGYHSGHRSSYGTRSTTTLSSSYQGIGLPSPHAQSDRDGGESFNGGGGWSLPRSSLRSVSGSSHSRSGSGSGDEPVVDSPPGTKTEADMDVVVEVVGSGNGGVCGRGYGGYGFGSRGRWGSECVERGISVVEEDEDDVGADVAIRKSGRDESRGSVWDGMEMEMEMD